MHSSSDPPSEGKPILNSEPLEKGGGYHGGPRRSTTRGPQPARHIPWPELFKRHISILEGHLKMVDMVRKYTVEGSGSHHQICDWLDQYKIMLHETKHLSRKFASPPNQRNKVPLGSSSVSTYPNYSPADHVNGKTALEAGKQTAAARAQGVNLNPADGIEYEVGQGKGIKRKMLADVRPPRNMKEKAGSGSDSVTDASALGFNGQHKKRKLSQAKPEDSKPDRVVSKSDAQHEKPKTEAKPRISKSTEALSGSDGQGEKSKSSETEPTGSKAGEVPSESAQPAFFIDTNPTPIDLPFNTRESSKRTSSDTEPTDDLKSKKVKKEHEGETPAPPAPGQIERIDITAEVDARMKEKEERRKRREEKKRKRESQGSSSALSRATDGALEAEKPKKKKSKKSEDAKGPEEASKKRRTHKIGDAGEVEGKKKRKI